MSDETVKIACPECGGGWRNHKILKQTRIPWDRPYGQGASTYQICECVGCETVRFRTEVWSSEDIDSYTGQPEITVRVYPEHEARARSQADTSHFPEKVTQIYAETTKARRVGALILAGAGLRAIVEAICIDHEVTGHNLREKIDELASEGLLAKPQADFLHEERYIGNAALHEVEPPTAMDIEDGLDIVETLLSTIYTLPEKARRLKERRESADGE